jgi:hypothetical protein
VRTVRELGKIKPVTAEVIANIAIAFGDNSEKVRLAAAEVYLNVSSELVRVAKVHEEMKDIAKLMLLWQERG